MDVTLDVDAVSHRFHGRADRFFVGRLALQRLFHGRRSVGLGAHAGDADARRRDRAARAQRHYRAHTRQRVVAGRLIELQVGRAGSRRLRLQAHLTNDLPLLQRRREHVDEEAVQVDIALATLAHCPHGATERQGDCRQIAGRVRVGKRTREGALRPDLRITTSCAASASTGARW